MKKNFLLLLLLTLLPLAGWSANIAVQLSTSLQKVYGTADPTTLSPTQFVIIADGGNTVNEADIAPYLTFKRKPGSTGESVGTYDWEVTVSDGWTGAPIVATNTGRISITPLDLSSVSLSATVDSPNVYDGNAKTPAVTNVQVGGFTLDPSDYTVTYDNNVNAGTANIIITAASGNVTGSNDGITFPIAQRTLSSITIADIAPVEYKKAAYDFESLQVSAITGKDAQNNEYAMSLTDFNEPVLTNATNAGEGTISLTVKAGGNFAFGDPVVKSFTITQRDISKISIGSISPFVYDGKAKKPTPALRDFDASLPNADFTRTWEDNINAGEATMIVTGKRNYTGTKEVKFNIAQKNLSTVTIADIAEYVYNGEAKTPVLTVSFNNGSEDVTLTKDEDYTVSYENNTTAGTATATITAVEGEGKNYTGSATKEFTINAVTVYIKPVAQSKFYGQADPNFAQATKAMYELVDGEGNAVENAVLNGTVALGRKAGETVGNYAIYVKSYTVNPEVADNYKPYNTWYVDDNELGSHTATFTINAQEAKLILKFKEGTPATKVYGDPTYAYSVNDLEVVSGLAGSDTWETLKGGATFTPTLESEDVHYDGNKVTATITGLANYPNIEVQPLAFTVTKRPIGIKPINQTIDYGEAISKTAGYWKYTSTLAFSDTKGDVRVELYTDEDVATFAPGSVNEGVIKARIADESNYELDEENSVWGTLTINAATALDLDDSKDDNLTKIKAFDGKTVNVTINFSSRNGRNLGGVRDWKQFDWMTLTLPFDISVSDLSKKLGYAIVNVIDDSRTVISGTSSQFYGKLTMTGGNGYVDPNDANKNDTKLAANKPFLVKIADDIADRNGGVIDFGLQTIVAPASAEDLKVPAGQGATFVGTNYAPYEVTKADKAEKWFMIGGGNGNWAYIGTTSPNTWELQSTEAYIQLPIETQSIIFNFEDVDGSTTAIKSVNADDLAGKKSAEGWYTLNGMKLQNAPAEKGVYIKDGKKVVLK